MKKILIIVLSILLIFNFLLLSTTGQPALINNNELFEDEINITDIWFNWGEESNAITLYDSNTERPIITPEYNLENKRNNSAAFIRNSELQIKVKFSSETNDDALIRATGDLIDFSEEQVLIENGISDWVIFNSIGTLPNNISNIDVKLNWEYFNDASLEWESIEQTSHKIYCLNKEPLNEILYEEFADWTTVWCENLENDDKILTDSIFNGFVKDEVIRYGDYGYEVAEILQTRDGMCGGLSWILLEACATQGVEIYWFGFQVQHTGFPEKLWHAMLVLDPGLGCEKPGVLSVKRLFRITNEVYPNPEYQGIFNKNDDIEIKYMHTYLFSKNSGHAVNLLPYNNTVYLYDLSFGNGPYTDIFTEIPEKGYHTSAETGKFRTDYFNKAVDYMYGRISYTNKNGKIRLTLKKFAVKTELIPDEINGENQIEFYFHCFNSSSDIDKSKEIFYNNYQTSNHLIDYIFNKYL